MREKKFLIIIADDDLDDQYIIQQAINETNLPHEVVLKKNGLELIDFLQKKNAYTEDTHPVPDMIIMDLNMPLLDGYGVLKQMKADERFREVPVYMLSTSRFEYDKLKSIELGAKDFFSKPYHFEDLKMIIKDICTRTFEFEGSK